MELFYALGLFIFVLVYYADPKAIRFDKEQYLRYVQIIAIGSAAAIGINYLLGRVPPLSSLSFGSLLLVGWEDLVFSLVPIYYSRKFLSPKIATIITVVASLCFGLGHIYINIPWAIITCFYPFFFSYKIGKDYGYGTVIATHVTYDVSVFGVATVLGYLGSL
jgi:hypothetical protein